MSTMLVIWSLDYKVIASLFHGLAIGSGIFRSTYRWYISRFGWDDMWALLALLTDVGSLVCSLLETETLLTPATTSIVLTWANAITLTSVLWEARLSIMTAIIRITNPRARTRHVSYAIAIAFGLMWIATLAQKMYNCATMLTAVSHGVAISQLITDVISDTLLVAMPVFFLKDMKISRGQRVLLVSSFASSICIAIITIAHSIVLFLPLSGSSFVIAQIKAALSVITCNLLVILTFIYRVFHNTDVYPSGIPVESEPVQFTSILPAQWSLGSCSCSASQPSPCTHCITSPKVDRDNVSPGLVHDSSA